MLKPNVRLLSAALLVAAITFNGAAQTTKGNLVGTWEKRRIKQEDHQHPQDKLLKLSVVFQDDGHFQWNAERKGPQGNWIDESVTGSYTVEGHLITYTFDKPSPEVLERLPEFFAFWPAQLRGQQTFQFRDGALRLGNDGDKTWVYLTRLEAGTPAD